MRGKADPNTAISGPPSVFRGSGPVLLRNPTFSCFLGGGDPDPLPPSSESAHGLYVLAYN